MVPARPGLHPAKRGGADQCHPDRCFQLRDPADARWWGNDVYSRDMFGCSLCALPEEPPPLEGRNVCCNWTAWAPAVCPFRPFRGGGRCRCCFLCFPGPVMSSSWNGRAIGRCKLCGKKLLLNDEGLCLPCENDELRRQLVESDLILAQCRREKKELYNSLIAERNRRLCCAEEG